MQQLIVLLFCVGLIGWMTYLAVRRVASLTRTPMWLLWLVAMLPVFGWMAWLVFSPTQKPLPAYFFLSFVLSFVLYLTLVQWGRIAPGQGDRPQDPERSSSNTSLRPSPEVNSPSPEADSPAVANLKSSMMAMLTPQMPPLNREEEANLRTCFPWSIYYLQTVECKPQAVICRGQLKSQPEVAYQTIRGNVEEQFGDRFLVAFQEGLQGRPFFALVPNPYAAEPMESAQPLARALRLQEPMARPGSALMLFGLTWLTLVLAWPVLMQQPAAKLAFTAPAMAYGTTLLLLLSLPELAHYWVACRHRLKLTLPYCIPCPPIVWFPYGSLGVFSQLRSPIPNRRVLFDLGWIGPCVSAMLLFPSLLWGFSQSQVVPIPSDPNTANWLQAFDPTISLLLTLVSKLSLGAALKANSAIALHPVAVAGCLGALLLGFKLMPVGRLNGGQIVHGMFGQRGGARIGHVARLLLLGLALVHPHLRLWALLFFLIPTTDEPTLNDVTELDGRRDGLGLGMLLLLLLLILPTPAPVLRALGL
jgi:membrane-associated protease RseP (regulator of RpoE activity)